MAVFSPPRPGSTVTALGGVRVIGVCHLQLQASKIQQQQAEEERLTAEHSKGRHAVERSNSKSTRRRPSSSEPPPTDAATAAAGVQDQLAALASKHEREVRTGRVHTALGHRSLFYPTMRQYRGRGVATFSAWGDEQ